ncbi:MAG TPA: RNA polymerase subunit sigma [Lachnospiraceae bacterium]|nr:RNA polymerase subunit sigma [Lachnospiraceae bacterium]
MWDMDGIYREHAELIYKYLFSLSLNTHTAEELAQETFYRAMLSIDTFNGSCKMSTWLCQIAKHLWYQELDKNRRRGTEPLDETLPDHSKSVESTVLDTQSKMSVYRMLHSLPEPMREVMYLRLSGELSFREIGELLSQSETWARVTFYRGKKKLMEGFE